MGCCALSTLVLYNGTFSVMQWVMQTLERTDAGYALFNASSAGIALLFMFPTAFCAGMTLPLITMTLLRKGHGEGSIGAVYAANTIGAILGVFFAIHAGMPLLGLKGLILSGAGLDIALGVALVWLLFVKQKPGRMPLLITAACIGTVVLAGIFGELDPYKMGSGVYRFGELSSPENSRLVFHKDGKTATISSFLSEGGLNIRTNGKVDAEIQLDPARPVSDDEPTMVLLAAVPLAYHPHAKNAAAVGFGSGLTSATLLKSDSIETVDTIEIEPVVIEGAEGFRPLVEPAYTDPRSHIYIDDAKTFFSMHPDRKYDIIISEPSNPWVSGVAGLFSKEYYHTISAQLADKGVFCQWLHLYELDIDLVMSVLKALSPSFSDYVIYATGTSDIVILAKNGTAIEGPDPALFGNPKLAAALNRIQINTIADLLLRKIGDRKDQGAFIEQYPIAANSDYYPILDQNAVRTRFLRDEAGACVQFRQGGPWALYWNRETRRM